MKLNVACLPKNMNALFSLPETADLVMTERVFEQIPGSPLYQARIGGDADIGTSLVAFSLVLAVLARHAQPRMRRAALEENPAPILVPVPDAIRECLPDWPDPGDLWLVGGGSPEFPEVLVICFADEGEQFVAAAAKTDED